MTVKLNSVEAYALMARCLRGESSPGDQAQLAELLAYYPDVKKEYEKVRELFQSSQTQRTPDASSSEDLLQKKFDQITRRLKDEGAL